jgi:adenine/guanine phosphoribosyltransferase-like PRPP-binding protein
VKLVDGSVLELPLRALPGGQQAIALLMSNQTPFAVEAALAPLLTGLVQRLAPEAIAAVPTMGLDYARLVGRALGHADYVALGLSRKFWYDDALSERVSSSTSPEHAKSIYLDPALVSRVAGRRVVLVDDVINTGASAVAAIRLLQRAGAQVEGLLVVLTEGRAWRVARSALGTDWPDRVQGVGHIPLFSQAAGGRWAPDPATL